MARPDAARNKGDRFPLSILERRPAIMALFPAMMARQPATIEPLPAIFHHAARIGRPWWKREQTLQPERRIAG